MPHRDDSPLDRATMARVQRLHTTRHWPYADMAVIIGISYRTLRGLMHDPTTASADTCWLVRRWLKNVDPQPAAVA